MSWHTTHWHPGLIVQLIILFCIFWPLIVAAFLRWRTRSPAPVVAMLLPVALAEVGVWRGLWQTQRGMARSGGGIASTSAGVAEAFGTMGIAALAIVFVAVVALIKRHRPVIDHVTAALAAALLVELVAAILFPARFAPTRAQEIVLVAWMGVTLATAFATAWWLAIVVRRETRALPYAVPVALVTWAVMAVIVAREAARYLRIAMTGLP